jgi:hypothetical protein
MTILRPSKKRGDFRLKLVFIIVAVSLLYGGIYIYEYNNFASLRYESEKLARELGEERIVNSDLRNKLYAILPFDPKGEFLADGSLVLEPKPKYLDFRENQ